jgi:hypothetical protein
MSRLSKTVSALSLFAAFAANPVHAVQRVFVASFGNDANTATNCTFANPCRGFTAAMTVVDPGGEVVALDAAGYGAVTITKSVTLTANPGFYAGISASTGNAVTIATAGVEVVLRGLNINGVGATNGVSMTSGASLAVENCVVSNFSSNGVVVDGPAKVRIVDSLVRDNNHGVRLQGGASGDVATSKVLANISFGIVAEGVLAGSTTTLVVTDTLVAGNQFGILSRALGPVTAHTRVSVIRSTISNSVLSAIVSVSGGANALLTLSESLVTMNDFGLVQSGGPAVLESLGNNTVRTNGTQVSGTVTVVAPM